MSFMRRHHVTSNRRSIAPRRFKRHGVVCLSAGAALALSAMLQTQPSHAVEFGKAVIGETVMDRKHPEYDPVGIRAGSFMFFPTINARAEYNDNIYADRLNPVSDAIMSVRPTVDMRSLWKRHSLRVKASGDLAFHAKNSSEDYQDAVVDVTGRYDISEASRISASVNAARMHERRDSPDDAGGITPTIIYRVLPTLTFDQRINRVAVRVQTALESIDFQNVEGPGGTIINENDRDRLTWDVEGRVGYDFSSSVQGFVSGSYNIRDYRLAVDDNGFNRDSQGYGVYGGVIVELTGTISAEAYVGYRHQTYDDAQFDDVGGVGGGLNVIWAPTKLTTVTFTGERTVEETTQSSGSGFFNTRFGVTVDHELRRNLIISLGGEYRHREYEGIARSDDNWRGTARVEYLLSRQFRLRAGYGYNTRSSTVLGDNFDINTAYVDLHVDY